MKFSNKDFFSKCDLIRRKLRIWSRLLKKSLMENFFFLWVVHLVNAEDKSCHDHNTVSNKFNHKLAKIYRNINFLTKENAFQHC